MVSSDDFETAVSRETDDKLKMEYLTFQALLAAIEPEWQDTLVYAVANEIDIAVEREICRRFCGFPADSDN